MNAVSGVVFHERQQFRQPWLWILNGVVSAVLLFVMIQFIWFSPEMGDKALPLGVFVFMMLSIVAGIALLWFIALETRIDAEGIHYRFAPFMRKYKSIAWTNVQSATIRRYSPILEYGGWGYRVGVFGAGKAFNVRGDIGIQLVFNNRKRLLIGTQKKEEVLAILNSLGIAGQEANSARMQDPK